MKWYVKVLKQYADFSGRARRKEFWMFTLINTIIWAVPYTLAFTMLSNNPESAFATILFAIVGLYGLGVFIPSLAVTVRRLHDTDRSGWWILIGLIPVIGFIVLLVFYVQNSQAGSNQYGENPKGVDTPAVA